MFFLKAGVQDYDTNSEYILITEQRLAFAILVTTTHLADKLPKGYYNNCGIHCQILS